jgi:sugar O-acyltransferase (sialic acid O-acetyltransferase NeuD family)
MELPEAGPVLIGLFGTGGCAREIMPLILARAARWAPRLAAEAIEIVYVETQPSRPVVDGVRVMSEAAFLSVTDRSVRFNVGIANSKVRQRIVQACEARGHRALGVAADNVVMYGGNQIGEGAAISAFSTITTNVRIGRFFHANAYTWVAHDCVIGDFVTFAPRVCCNGNVHIHDHAYIGAGAVIKQGTPDKPLVIGEGATVGMGAVVTKDVAPYATVIGNPARPMNRR